MPNTTRRVGIAIIAAGLLLGMPLQAQAKAGTGPVKTVSAYTNLTEPPGTFTLSLACPGPDCGWVKAEYNTELHGPAISGWEEVTLYTLPDPAHPGALQYHGTAVFHVTESPCGIGTFTESVTNGTAYVSNIDPDRTLRANNDWTIISGSGTGQLEGIEGTGTDVADLDADGEGRGVHDGTLTCRLHR